jgi:hypothetical protein
MSGIRQQQHLIIYMKLEPSYSVPYSVLVVIGEKAFHTIVSQILVAMKSEIPLPNPYPLKSSDLLL